MADTVFRVRREHQAPGIDIAFDHRIETRFVDRNHAASQQIDLARVNIDADDVITGIRETGARDEADVPRAEYADLYT